MDAIIIIIAGLAIGWLMNLFFKGRSFGKIVNPVIGVFGAVFAYWLIGKTSIQFINESMAALITGIIGAFVVLMLANLLYNKKLHS